MNTADLITSFFNNEMSPDQERQFLLSVASSDSLRLGLKSHVMLDKILQEQSSRSRVSAQVRMNIMKQAAVVAAAGSALAAENALAGNDTGQNTGQGGSGAGSAVQHNASAGASRLSDSRGFFRWSSVTLALLLGVGGFFTGFYTGTESAGDTVLPAARTAEENATVSPELSGVSAQAPASSISVPATEQENESGRQAVPADRGQEGRNGRTLQAQSPATHTSRPAAVGRSGGNTTSSSVTTSAQNGTSASNPGEQGEPMNGSTIRSNALEIVDTNKGSGTPRK